jgi:hypothetical protein
MAERVGFEPTVEFPLHSLSRRALSTAQTPLRSGFFSLANPLSALNWSRPESSQDVRIDTIIRTA